MNTRVLSLTSLSLLALAPASVAIPGTQPAVVRSALVEEASGEITKVDLENLTFELQMDERKATLRVDRETKYYLDGEESSREAVLKVGHTVSVTHDGRLASRVSARSKPGAQ